jgi:murE/murF fusion protein
MLELHTPLEAAHWLRSRVTGTLQTDSRKVTPGDGFIAWPGAATDARRHVASALANGASACLMEHVGLDDYAFSGEYVASYASLKAASGPIAAAYFEQPTQHLDVVAITGTNGKTSTAWWLAQALSGLKGARPIPCAMVGTLGIGLPPVPGADSAAASIVATGLTTPDPVLLQQACRRFVDQGIKACAVEASSIGIEEHRLDGTHIRTAVFTNFTQDHLDYHGTMGDYWLAKARLFQWPGLQSAVINTDDTQGLALATMLAETALDVWTISGTGPARLRAFDIQYNAQGLQFSVEETGVEVGQSHRLQTKLIGAYNVLNLLGVMAAMRTLGVPLADAVAACVDLTPVPGRMAFAGGLDKPLAVVDYAHTPDALGQALLALRALADQRGGQLWCVFGCGGDRDAAKRPLMGAMAARYADQVVVTSDNPRSEKPGAIISQILLGLAGHQGVTVEVDRALAIAQAFAQAGAGDVLLVAGKGHEDYQEQAGLRLEFSDEAHVRQALSAWVPPRLGHARDDAPMMTLEQAQSWLTQANVIGAADVAFKRVHTDTRTIEEGDLFVALKGERFDANDFLSDAKARGAVAALCQGDDAALRLQAAGLPGLVVKDAKLALAELATHWRAQFTLPLIAVTGSNGKTTVTQMVASILRTHKPDTFLATQGNLNNEIGVPLTLLRLRQHTQVAVVELGMNHPGEIATLAAMAQPTVALVNNAQREHLEFMATVEAVAQENSAVIDALSAQGMAVFPSDDLYSPLWVEKAGARKVLQFCLTDISPNPADVYSHQARWVGDAWQVSANTPAGAVHFKLAIAGLHNVKNSLAAVACALAADVPLDAISRGLSAFEPVNGRSRACVIRCEDRSVTLVDDTYNANPDSVQAAIHVLAALPGPHLLVLGDMGEVGNQGPEFHAEAGQLAKSLGIESLFTLGDLSTAAANGFGAGRHFSNMQSLQAAVLESLPSLGSVLVKGSRFMKMERVVQAMTAHTQQDKKEIHAH